MDADCEMFQFTDELLWMGIWQRWNWIELRVGKLQGATNLEEKLEFWSYQWNKWENHKEEEEVPLKTGVAKQWKMKTEKWTIFRGTFKHGDHTNPPIFDKISI